MKKVITIYAILLCLLLIACGDDPTVKPAAPTNTVAATNTVKTIAPTTAAPATTVATTAAPAMTAPAATTATTAKTSPTTSPATTAKTSPTTSPATTGSPQASTKAKVTGTDGQGVRLRKEPRIPKTTEPTNVLVTIAENQEVDITGALKASEGLNWWPVTYKGQSGWVAQDYLKK